MILCTYCHAAAAFVYLKGRAACSACFTKRVRREPIVQREKGES
jgi:hypothetical protein